MRHINFDINKTRTGVKVQVNFVLKFPLPKDGKTPVELFIANEAAEPRGEADEAAES